MDDKCLNFYVVENPRFDDMQFAYGEKHNNPGLGPPLKCEECGSYLTMMKWLPPHEIDISKRSLGDFIYGGFTGFIVSSRFKTLFEMENLKGIQSFQPVTLFFRGQQIDELFYLPHIVMSNARIDLKRSGFEFDGESKCSSCQKAGNVIIRYEGVIFESAETINLDVFYTKVLGETPIVSQNFKDFVDRSAFTNISLTIATQYKRN